MDFIHTSSQDLYMRNVPSTNNRSEKKMKESSVLYFRHVAHSFILKKVVFRTLNQSNWCLFATLGTESFGLFSCTINGEERDQTHRAVYRYDHLQYTLSFFTVGQQSKLCKLQQKPDQ